MLERLGEFTIKKKLGEGGMGGVYLAYQESLDREVALKVLTERLCQNEKFISRFKREARSAASIIHPNVIQIYSIGEDHGIHYFAMEYVRGEDLMRHLAKGRRFSVEEALHIVIQVAEAIACAAEAGIVHRDIKPANIMLDERGRVKVTDFGLAKTESSDLNVTEVGTIVGTANYMSPEQGQGKPLDTRSDIYSLGVVFFELLTGRPPFIAEQPSAVLFKHIYEDRPRPSDFNPAVPPAVDRMVQRMMARDPADRPPNAEALLAELRGLLQSLGTVPSPSTTERRLASPFYSPSSVADRHLGEEGKEEVPTPLPIKVLVADDVASVRKLYSKVLGAMGWTILEAADGVTALELWRRERPHILLLDLNMPKKNGVEVLEAARGEKLPGEVIVISAHKSREIVSRVAQYGVSHYLTKPVNLTELRGRIQKILALPEVQCRLHAASELAESAPAASSVVSAPPPVSLLRIVVYDTEVYSRNLYRGLLEGSGRQVACVDSEKDASSILDETLPDLFVVVVSQNNAGSFSLLERIRSRGLSIPVLTITEERDAELVERMKAMHLGPVLSKPVHIEAFRAAVKEALERPRPKPKECPAPAATFDRVVEAQFAKENAYTVFDFARDLAGMLPPGAKKSFELRLQEGSTREVEQAILNLLRRLKTENRLEEGMRYLKHAYREGNLQVRDFCLTILAELLPPREEIPILLKLITDEDYRIRIRVIERLADLQAEEAIPVLIRFFADDVWKVRRAAEMAIQRFPLSAIIEPVILFYAHSAEPLADSLRSRLLAGIGPLEIERMEGLARASGVEVRCFIARLVGEVKSKLAVRLLLTLMRDKVPEVRASAARAAGAIQNEKLLECLHLALTDSNSEVQKAVIESLRCYPLTPEAEAFLLALGSRGRLISEDAVRFFQTLNVREGALQKMLETLERQRSEHRKFLSLLLEFLFPDGKALGDVVRLLSAGEERSRREGIERVLAAVRLCVGRKPRGTRGEEGDSL